jgi:uncharacterized protein YdbL (DUF1318 family)
LALDCTPRVRLEAPEKPIIVKLEVTMKQEVRFRVEDAVESGTIVNPGIPLAKEARWIGERFDGYLDLVGADVPDEVRVLVVTANADRRKTFERIAAENNLPLQTVERIAGRKFVAGSSKGEFVMPSEGEGWVRVE